MKYVSSVFMGCLVFLGGCCCPGISPEPTPTPPCNCPRLPLVNVPFERTVWAFPVGVEIRYPAGVSNQEQVRVFAEVPTRFDFSWACCVTTAKIVTSGATDPVYTAIPVATNTPVGVRWYIVALPEQLVELERLSAPIQYIEVLPLVAQ